MDLLSACICRLPKAHSAGNAVQSSQISCRHKKALHIPAIPGRHNAAWPSPKGYHCCCPTYISIPDIRPVYTIHRAFLPSITECNVPTHPSITNRRRPARNYLFPGINPCPISTIDHSLHLPSYLLWMRYGHGVYAWIPSCDKNIVGIVDDPVHERFEIRFPSVQTGSILPYQSSVSYWMQKSIESLALSILASTIFSRSLDSYEDRSISTIRSESASPFFARQQWLFGMKRSIS